MLRVSSPRNATITPALPIIDVTIVVVSLIAPLTLSRSRLTDQFVLAGVKSFLISCLAIFLDPF